MAINGVTFGKLYELIDPYPSEREETQTAMLKCVTICESVVYERMAGLKHHWLFSNLDVEMLLELVPRLENLLNSEDHGPAGGHGKGHGKGRQNDTHGGKYPVCYHERTYLSRYEIG